MKLSIIIPIFNEEDVIALTLARIIKTANSTLLSGRVTHVELVFVDDGSSDLTVFKLKQVPLENAKIEMKIISFSRNFGHSLAVLAGLENSTGDILSIIDGDLQDPPEVLQLMIEELQTGKWDVVYGQRRFRGGETAFKRMTAWLFYRLMNFLSQVAIPKDTGDFRVLTKEVRDAVLEIGDPEPFIRGLVAWVGFRQKAHLYDRDARALGVTKYPFKKMFRFALQAILSFSSFPLKLSIYIGIFGILTTLMVGFYALVTWMAGKAMPGWTSLVLVFSFGQSLMFFLIGVLGLYVGRIHTASQGRPRYIVRR